MEQRSDEQQPLLSADRRDEQGIGASGSGNGGDLERGTNYNGSQRRRQVDEEEEDEGDDKSWRKACAETLESERLHKVVIALIAIDGACVLADLAYSFLSEECSPPNQEEYLPPWLLILSYISLTITSLFLIEIPISIWAFGPKFYNPLSSVTHSSLHLFDAVIIITTFVLEAVLRGRERELAGLLVLLRLWRLVKLVGGLAVGAGELNEEMSLELQKKEQQLKEQSIEIERLKDENNHLRSRLGYNVSADSSVQG